MTDLLLRRVRLLLDGPDRPVDLRIAGGVVAEVGPSLRLRGEEHVVDAEGRWAAPGLWDAHVHLQQWARTLERLDVSGTDGPDAVCALVAARLRQGDVPDLLIGYGHRSAGWSTPPTTAALDAAAGRQAVVLVSGDAHHGWMSSAALHRLGLPPREGPLEETAWFEVLTRLENGTAPHLPEALRAAADRGVVGVVDMEWEQGVDTWPVRFADGLDLLRVRCATYASGLDAVLSAGLRTGDVLDEAGLLTVGPFKVIFDGSLNTSTAWCCAPYPGAGHGWRGVLNHTVEELTTMVGRAHAGGLEAAVHAIGDAAGTLALDAFAATGARGSVEHVQLVAREDLPRFAALGVRASVQPAHLLDDRDVTARLWPDRQDRSFALRSLLTAGATLALGSDAPVARLDPWLAMAAAVHRSADDRPAWQPQEALAPREALAASTDGRRLRVGEPGDVVLLDDDPLAPSADTAEAAARLRDVRVAGTFVGGRRTSG